MNEFVIIDWTGGGYVGGLYSNTPQTGGAVITAGPVRTVVYIVPARETYHFVERAI